MIRIPQSYQLGENYLAFKNEVLSYSDFVHASFMDQAPPNIQSTSFLKSEHTDQLIGIVLNASDHDLIATMGYVMKEGRFFSKEFLSDSNAVVINETAARMFDFKTIEGKRIGFSDDNMFNVIGVVRDFNFASLKSDIKPMATFLSPENTTNFVVRVTAGDPTEKIDVLQSVWKKYAEGKPFQYSFVDEDYDLLFRAEQRLGTVFLVFTGMAIVIACLGLFGLITYTAAQRTKEIGIRKVLGASQGQVVFLLVSAIGRLLLISFVISIPIAWYGLEQWLQSFAYRTTFDTLSVLVACVAGLSIVLLTVGYRSLRAASANPVDSLKNE
jgi:putative ABC transport system permease protein